MSWLILVILATVLDAARIFIDNYSSDCYFKGRDAVSQKLFYGYAWIITILPVIFFFWEEVSSTPIAAVLLLIFAGMLHGLSGVPYFKALEIDDSTNMGIFIQLAPVLYLVLGWIFLGESVSLLQLVAIGIILLAPILIVVTARKRSRKIRMRAVLLSVLYVLIAVISNLVFVHVDAGNLSIIPKVSLVLLGKGISNLIIVYVRPKWRKRFFTVLKTSHYKVLRPMIVNHIVGTTKEFVYRAALVAAPAVAIASAASDSVLPVVIFFMGIVLTLIWPKFGREKLNRKNVLVHLLATVLVVIGIVLLQF